VSVGSPAPLFEKLDDDDQLLADCAPFSRVMPRGGSRKGRPNKRTEAMRDLYLRLGLPHPMLKMGQALAMPVEELAKALSCEKLDAFEIQRKIAADLMPYLESKMPTQVVGEAGEALPVLVIREIEAARGPASGAAPGAMAIDDDLAAALDDNEEKQRLIAAARDGSHGAESHGEANSQQDQAPSERGAAD
jgi:hypothetical protein